jgi:hypothetical protein
MSTHAAILAATLAAHRKVEQLDARMLRDLREAYADAAAAIAAQLEARAGVDGNLTLDQLRAALDQIEAILRHLNQLRDQLLQDALHRAIDAGLDPFRATLSTATLYRVSQDAVLFLRRFVAEDGLQLSDRLWRLSRGARDQVVNAIEQAVIKGYGAAQAANEFLGRGQAVPADLQGKVGQANVSRIGRDVRELMTGKGEPLTNALRVFRTEINRAHGEAYMKTGEELPDFGGWRFLLSPAHPAPDICDKLSTQDLYGLGPGVYPTREKTPWPAHPNTLSFIVIVFKDELPAKKAA